MADHETQAHEALIFASRGYEQFYEHELRDARELGPEPDWEEDRRSLLMGFAAWLSAGHRAERFAYWAPEQFRAEWERWNS